MYGLTQFLSIGIFGALNHLKTIKLTRQILLYQFKKDTVDAHIKVINKASKLVSPVRLTKNTMLELYQELRKHVKPEVFEEIEKGLKEPKQNLEANFTLAFRMMLAITVYYFSLPQFGLMLYLIAMVVLILGMYVLMISYSFLDILPALMRKFHLQAEEYLNLHLQQSGQNKMDLDNKS